MSAPDPALAPADEHRAAVRLTGELGARQVLAACTCGWTGPARPVENLPELVRAAAVAGTYDAWTEHATGTPGQWVARTGSVALLLVAAGDVECWPDYDEAAAAVLDFVAFAAAWRLPLLAETWARAVLPVLDEVHGRLCALDEPDAERARAQHLRLVPPLDDDAAGGAR